MDVHITYNVVLVEKMPKDSFSNLVNVSWSKAVAIASKDLLNFRTELIQALASSDPEERSAAIASFNEGNDDSAHVQILSLLNDPIDNVRMEAAEYIESFGRLIDIPMIFNSLRIFPDIQFLLTRSLCAITGRDEGLIDDEDSKESIEKEIQGWFLYLRDRSLI